MADDDGCFLLDLGLYAGDDLLRRHLVHDETGPRCRTLTLDSDTAQVADWDAALIEILRSRRCITL